MPRTAISFDNSKKDQLSMQLIRPNIIGTLRIEKMMAGNPAVINGIKSSPNKIIIPCRSIHHGKEIIQKLKDSKPGELLHL